MHSQRWMFMSPGGENEYKKPSVSSEHYGAVAEAKVQERSAETENERKRREMENSLWKQMAEKVFDQIKKKEEQTKVIQFRSTYEDTFVKPGFQVKELGTDIDKELQQKYPLYTDTAKTIYLKELHKLRAKDAIHKPDSTIFRKDSRFTSRLSNPLDVHTPVEPGHFAYV